MALILTPTLTALTSVPATEFFSLPPLSRCQRQIVPYPLIAPPPVLYPSPLPYRAAAIVVVVILFPAIKFPPMPS